MEKKSLRAKILKIRDALGEAERHNYSTEIAQKVLSSKEYKKAQKVLLYASFRSEVDTGMLTQQALNDGKEVYFPKIQKRENGRKEMEFYRVNSEEDLEKGYYGIPEPREDSKSRLIQSISNEGVVFEDQFQTTIERQQMRILVIIPGAVFDKKGNRIGYGGGFYDKYLTRLENKVRQKPNIAICKMALAFECQMVSSDFIEVESHDIKVDAIVTEKDIYTVMTANI